METIKYVAGRQERETGSHAGWGVGVSEIKSKEQRKKNTNKKRKKGKSVSRQDRRKERG